MVATLEQSQLQAIATKLADMKALQQQIVANEEKLIAATSGDKNIRDRLQSMLEDDRENLNTIDQVVNNFSVQSQPNGTVQALIESVEGIMAGNELTLYQKALQHEGLKHQIVMTGLTLHKASQVVGDDFQKTIDPLYQLNFKNRAHQEQLKSVVTVLGTRELTGKNPDDSIWAQSEDAIAAVRGLFKGLS
ncbi:MAG: hemerythrin HHE cation-binding protein [Cyanobacteria bacterium QH_6_48_35]|jgi:hypothetical protein|nr:MAG: hemerythrin HHE cation-binding protein [Cyanobacteria bacterium QH_1_48_107]PSO56586.1 MAG: hemerythrin HHE cation-binding protein [Cyanobacteria bacterium QH_10_48_56]PSO62323.1 MAG: hemerythrin HHE cation-binding protein [Cyanobacteria bacterium QH_2_48_84]PSO65474.1 MAG: hemerythrin HHE cation-binding protein [Cyanobacteria bacterium QH_6_48_35]PSO74738.1 MAG: hemerythrin HHE cation-binding protein [Cyanobacteria bacterium QH_3_48_40]PSO81682.1 MAG: hemerythrin HHE cation-binding pr